jgi:hypothetical protein
MGMERKIHLWVPALALLVGLLLSACASTKMTSQVNPEVLGRPFRKVLAMGNFQSLEYRRLAEQTLCSGLVGRIGCQCVKSSDVFFPGQQYSAEQIASRLTELRIDAVLILQPTGTKGSSIYAPQSSYAIGNAIILGNTVMGGTIIFDTPWATFEAILVATSDHKVAWYATAESAASKGWASLIKSASRTTVKRLVSDGVFQKPRK